MDMNHPDESPTDSTSIKPVSSLRSKFEHLANDHPSSKLPTSLPIPLTPNKLDLRTSNSPIHLQPTSTSVVRSSLDSQRPVAPSGPLHQSPHHVARPSVATRAPMSTLSTRSSPPSLHVEPPTSPPKPPQPPPFALASPRPPSSPTSVAASPITSATHSRTPSRSTTPALEARMSAFLHAAQLPASLPPEPEKRKVDGSAKPKPPNFSAAPPVNRAGKPRLPSMAAPLGDSLNPCDAMLPTTRRPSADHVSPFHTPPSSSGSTPPGPSPPSLPNHSKPHAPTQLPHQQRDLAAALSDRLAPDHAYQPTPDKPARPVSQSFDPRAYPPSSERLHVRPPPFQDGADEHSPGLPPRPARQIQSGRTSPVRQQRIPARASLDIASRPNVKAADDLDSQLMPPPRRTSKQSALTQGFASASASVSTTQKPPAPAIPAPRRSADHRREDIRIAAIPRPIHTRADDPEECPVTRVPGSDGSGPALVTDFPNSTEANRRPPQFSTRPWEIGTGYDTRLFAVCGEYVCTTGFITRVFNLRTGETCLTLAHSEGVKITALAFKPTSNAREEGQRFWLGTSTGEIHEVDIPTQSVVSTKQNAHPRREIVKLHRYASQLWSLDVEGSLHVWSAGREGMPNLDTSPRPFRTIRGHSASIVVGGQLWLASGKAIYVFQPNATSEASFQVLQRPLQQDSAGDVTSAAVISSKPDLVYFGHADGKVSIYNRRDYQCVGLVSISPYKILSLAGAADRLWAGYATGRIYVYDTSVSPWRVLKDWQAHDKPVCNIIADSQSLRKSSRLQVVSLGLDNTIRLWDGLLEEDWLENQMQKHDDHFSSFSEMTASVLTWNAGATKPHYLKNNDKDNRFFEQYLTSQGNPDIFIFGFQELVDLEDKKVTAKSFFKSKKKDSNEQEHVGHEYRAWRDHISRCIQDFLADQPYVLLHTSSMVGLFSCVFVKNSLRGRIKQVNATEIKRGMGGRHGNKGALIVRMIVDDSSLCLVNCHLAAGQSATSSRNTDVAAILESSCLPETADDHAPGTFVGGGDGSMILDHELCIWNGDLNYRIDAMPRDTVVKAVRDRNLAKLLERDQLLLSRKRNPTFRLQVFQEMPITFAPTYKYDVGTDDYDSSEKKRAPAWCDRVLFRGVGRIKGDDYRRWEVKISDHRPVSAHFRMRIKKIDEQKRKHVRQAMEEDYELYKQRIIKEEASGLLK